MRTSQDPEGGFGRINHWHQPLFAAKLIRYGYAADNVVDYELLWTLTANGPLMLANTLRFIHSIRRMSMESLKLSI